MFHLPPMLKTELVAETVPERMVKLPPNVTVVLIERVPVPPMVIELTPVIQFVKVVFPLPPTQKRPATVTLLANGALDDYLRTGENLSGATGAVAKLAPLPGAGDLRYAEALLEKLYARRHAAS